MKARKRARMIFRYFTYSKIRTAGIISVLSLAIFIYEDDAYAATYLQKREITAGRMCRAKDEIVVSEDYLSRSGFKVGDILHVNIVKEDMTRNKNLYEKVQDFVITGAADNLSEEAALVSKSFCNASKSIPDNARIKLKRDSDIDSNVSSLVKAYHIAERIQLNEALIAAIANEQKINGMKSTLELCMLLIAIMVCYYILNSNVNQKMQDMGIMRCLGFDTPEMVRILIDENV